MQSLVGVQNTYGAQAAFGIPIFKFPKRKGELRFGMAGKTLWRNGGYQEPTLTQLLTFDFKNIANGFTKSGVGYGLDSGIQLVYRIQKDLELLSGLAINDMGNTSFSNGPDPQKSNTTFGISTRYTRSDMVATFAYDYSHLFDFMDWRLKTHLGMEVKFPFIRLYLGLNQLYPTYGAGFDLGLIRFMLVSYASEQSVSWGVNPDRRLLGNVSIKLSL